MATLVSMQGQVFTPAGAIAPDGRLGLAYYVLRGSRVQSGFVPVVTVQAGGAQGATTIVASLIDRRE